MELEARCCGANGLNMFSCADLALPGRTSTVLQMKIFQIYRAPVGVGFALHQ